MKRPRLRFPVRKSTFCLLLSMGAVVLSAAAATGETTNAFVDITGTFRVNECTGETVTLDGQVHISTSVTPNADGSFHIRVHSNTQGVSGTGDITGDSYRFNETENFSGEFEVPAGGSGHLVGHQEFIHQGESGGLASPTLDDKHVHFNTTVTLDAAGNPVTSFVPSVECR
jgi:hypothetical protein